MRQLKTLRVAIDVSILPGSVGGVAPATLALLNALGRLQDGPEVYTVIVRNPDQLEWLKPFSGPNQRFVVRTSYNKRWTFARCVKCLLGPFLPVAHYLQWLINFQRDWPDVPLSDGFYENLGCDVIHFPTQAFVLCALPSIYNPHDLQHLQYPQFFTPVDIAHRERIYPTACHLSHTVVVGSQWVKDDIIRRYQLSPDKIQVIPLGPPTQSYIEPTAEHLRVIKTKYQLDEGFAFYPAVTWPHKNHLRLLEALALLRDDHGLTIPLVCTGSRYELFWPRIQEAVDKLRLSSQVRFLGFVPDVDLRALYRLAQFLIIPSLYEADSCPVYEAWLEGLPVACSNVTGFPDQVIDAALLFDPFDVGSIANALARVASDEGLRCDLQQRGYRRAGDFDWERTAKAYRAVYRRAA